MTTTNPTSALVLGLGLSGVAAVRLLRAGGTAVVGVDRRSRLDLELDGIERDPGVDLLLGAEPATPPEATDLVVTSPGVPFDHPLLTAARHRGIEVIGELELGFRHLPANSQVVAVTGSNGKSTTTALAGHLIAADGRAVEVCGNIGRPLSACALGTPGRTFVVEVSSFQLETVVGFHAHAAAVLNLSPDHLDRHHDMATYAATKGRIFATQGPQDYAITNADDPWVCDLPSRARHRRFSLTGPVVDGCWRRDNELVEVDGHTSRVLCTTSQIPLPGEHNLENVMAAALLARALGVGADTIAEALPTFRGLPHRLELVAEVGGVRFVDDSKATNVASAVRGIAGFPNTRLHVILGGRPKTGDDLAHLARVLEGHATSVWLIGEATPSFAAALAGSRLPVTAASTLDRAVTAAAASAAAGDVVLLAPAAASYDQYRNYVERGLHFRSLAQALATTEVAG
jgi:UDP-N-acetylmuramoylalanine--D-glutamate ligase